MQLLDYQDPPVSEFRAATSQDARSAMVAELGNLLRTVPEEDRRVALLYCNVMYCTVVQFAVILYPKCCSFKTFLLLLSNGKNV